MAIAQDENDLAMIRRLHVYNSLSHVSLKLAHAYDSALKNALLD
jgi:hypothetical protein